MIIYDFYLLFTGGILHQVLVPLPAVSLPFFIKDKHGVAQIK